MRHRHAAALRSLAVLALAVAALGSCASPGRDAAAGDRTLVAGVVLFPGKVSIPHGSSVVVTLAQAPGGSGATAAELARTQFAVVGPPPWRFMLDCQANAVKPADEYVLSAEVTSEGGVRYRGSVPFPGDPDAQPASADVLVRAVR